MSSVAVVVPIYQARLPAIEAWTLAHSLAQLAADRRVVFTGPEGLDLGWYQELAASTGRQAAWLPFGRESFASIPGYSRLLTSVPFYRALQGAGFSHTLILQTDALLLVDALDRWCTRPFDYVGAPWPEGVEILVNLDRHAGAGGVRIKSFVGNGGLSLRRNQACLDLLAEFPQGLQFFQKSGSSEDLFFAMLGQVSTGFVLPNEMTAALFARELQPRRYHAIHRCAPLGGHAWWKYDPGYWLEQLQALGTDVGAARQALRSLLDTPGTAPADAAPLNTPVAA
jgi:hypothetical protein